MAKFERKRVGEFLRKIYELLWDKPGGLPAKEILAYLGLSTKLTEFEKGSYDSTPDTPRYEKIIRFATIDLVKAGWLIKSKGFWYLTDAGKEAYNKYKDPEAFYGEAQRLYYEWRRNLPSKDNIENLDEGEEENLNVSITFEQAEENAWEQIKNHFKLVSPYEFQDLVAHLLTAMGYHVSWVAPPGKDGGVDVIAHPDLLGTSETRIKVQVKHRIDQQVGVENLRSFMATLGTNDVGLFVTSGSFSKDALDEARKQEQRRITCLDLEKLFDLWVKYYDKLPQEARLMLPLKPVYYLAPEE